MRVTNIQVHPQSDRCELRADVWFDSHWVWGDEPFRLWYSYPHEYLPFLSASNGDPFLTALLPPAMVLGEPLTIEADVSPRLLRSSRKVQEILQCWNADFRKVDVSVTPREGSFLAPLSSGLFSSLGVDSSYSLAKSLTGDAHELTHLINVLGFDIYLWEQARYPAVLRNISQVSESLGMSALPITTNLREMSDRIVDWVRVYHGAALASTCLALRGLFRTVSVAATHTYAELRPLGTHPLLDPLWSTEETEFIHDGCEADRFTKLSQLAAQPMLLKKLRVCASDFEGPVYNCGRCQKCLRTMLGLHILGLLKECDTLPHTIDPAQVRAIKPPSPWTRAQLAGLRSRLGTEGEDAVLREALDACLAAVPASTLTA